MSENYGRSRMTPNEMLADFLREKPEEIKLAAMAYPPDKLYRIPSGHIAVIKSYMERLASADKCVFCVAKLGMHNHYETRETACSVFILKEHNPDILCERRVWGIHLTELIPVPEGTVARGLP